MREDFVLAGKAVKAGSRKTIDIPVARLYTHTHMDMPVHVVHGRKPGPCLFVTAAIHGDEINGVEVIRRLLKMKILENLHGTLLAVPIVNVFGFMNHSRYLPDNRDLNRSFPGSEKGSLASRLAHLFMAEIVSKSNYGIDIHTGSNHRSNYPQIRACLDHEFTYTLARVFGAPVVLNAALRDGSMREAAMKKGVPLLVFEGGESLRFEENAVRICLNGILSIMRYLEMLHEKPSKVSSVVPRISNSSTWVRMPSSGILSTIKRLGDVVEKDEVLGVIADPFGKGEIKIKAPISGMIIGKSQLPLVYKGDGIYHLASFSGEDLESLVADEDSRQSPEGPFSMT